MIRYDRAPSTAFRALLEPGGILSPLLARHVVAGLPLDVHLREGDHIHAYCGLTRLVDAWRSGGCVHVAAYHTYSRQACAGDLFRAWAPDEAGFGDSLASYLAGVAVKPALVRGEGAVQAAWAAVRAPWVPFDREAVLGYLTAQDRSSGLATRSPAAAKVRCTCWPRDLQLW